MILAEIKEEKIYNKVRSCWSEKYEKFVAVFYEQGLSMERATDFCFIFQFHFYIYDHKVTLLSKNHFGLADHVTKS